MKKLTLVFFLILVPYSLFANVNKMDGTTISSSSTIDGVGVSKIDGQTVCQVDSCTGTRKFSWHMEDNDSTPDVTVGCPTGCSDGDTIGAESGSPGFSSSQASDGSYSLYIDALDEYYEFAQTGDELCDPDDIGITFDIYVSSFPGSNQHEIIKCAYNGTNYLQIRLETSTLRIYNTWQGNYPMVEVTISSGEWVSCNYQALSSAQDHYLNCVGSSTGNVTDEDLNEIGAQAAASDVLRFGDIAGATAGAYYLDNVDIGPNTRY